jgi:cell division GTPase FtsZ
METNVDLKDLRLLYGAGVNIIEHLMRLGLDRNNAIEISYDLQAGSYIKFAQEN